MMREEFEQLTGISVGYSYYTEVIEPEYAAGTLEKQAFCTNWKKAHKQELVTCINREYTGLMSGYVTIETKYQQAQRRLEETQNVCNQEIGRLKGRNMELLNAVATMSEQIDSNADKFLEKDQIIQEIQEAYRNELEDQRKAKDLEIMKLKAQLFDLLYNKTA